MKHTLLAAATLLLLSLPEATACVGCRQPGTEGPVEPQTVTAGIALSWGVVGMLGIVLAIVGGLVYYIADTCRKLDRRA